MDDLAPNKKPLGCVAADPRAPAGYVRNGTPAERLLERLHGVRERGPGRWLARCPAHDDRSPSLSIRELHGGVVLLHCFGGCSVADVVRAVGLDLAALFPPQDNKPGAGAPRVRRPWSAHDLLALATFESQIVAVAAAGLAHGTPLSETDRARLLEAAARLRHIAEAAR